MVSLDTIVAAWLLILHTINIYTVFYEEKNKRQLENC
jgi:hypothetical protein